MGADDARAGWARSRLEPVADTPHRGDPARVFGIVLDLVADTAHVHRDRRRILPVGRRLPHVPEQVGSREHLAWGRGEVGEDEADGLCFQTDAGFVVEAVTGPGGEFPVIDDNGTPAGEDDIDYRALQKKLARWRERVTDVRYEIKYRTITREMDSVLISYRYSASFRIAYDEEDQRWSRRIGENRLVLLYDDIQARYYVLSGM